MAAYSMGVWGIEGSATSASGLREEMHEQVVLDCCQARSHVQSVAVDDTRG